MHRGALLYWYYPLGSPCSLLQSGLVAGTSRRTSSVGRSLRPLGTCATSCSCEWVPSLTVCVTVLSVSQYCMCHSNVCATVMFVSPYCLCHSKVCVTVLPLPQECSCAWVDGHGQRIAICRLSFLAQCRRPVREALFLQ